jgi:hypothetical protein
MLPNEPEQWNLIEDDFYGEITCKIGNVPCCEPCEIAAETWDVEELLKQLPVSVETK